MNTRYNCCCKTLLQLNRLLQPVAPAIIAPCIQSMQPVSAWTTRDKSLFFAADATAIARAQRLQRQSLQRLQQRLHRVSLDDRDIPYLQMTAAASDMTSLTAEWRHHAQVTWPPLPPRQPSLQHADVEDVLLCAQSPRTCLPARRSTATSSIGNLNLNRKLKANVQDTLRFLLHSRNSGFRELD